MFTVEYIWRDDDSKQSVTFELEYDAIAFLESLLRNRDIKEAGIKSD